MLDAGAEALGEETPSPLAGASRREQSRTTETASRQGKHKRYMYREDNREREMENGRHAGALSVIQPNTSTSRHPRHTDLTATSSPGNRWKRKSRRATTNWGEMANGRSDDLKELDRVAAKHKQRLKRLEDAENALAVVNSQVAQSEDEHRKIIAIVRSANELLGEKRRELKRTEKQLAESHVEREELVTTVAAYRQKLDVVQSAVREREEALAAVTSTLSLTQREVDSARTELIDVRQSVEGCRHHQRELEAALRKCAHEQEHFSNSAEEMKSECKASGCKLQHVEDETELKQSELSFDVRNTLTVDKVNHLEQLLASVCVVERERDELQEQCDFIGNEIMVKEEELEELRDRLEEGIYDAQKKERDTVQVDNTLQEKQRQIADKEYELSQKQSEVVDLHHVFELEESSLLQLLREKDQLCHPMNEIMAGLRQELQSVEMDIKSQEKRMERLKGLKSEMRRLEMAVDRQRLEYENVTNQLDKMSSELVTCRSELDNVMMKVQQKQQELNTLSKENARIGAEQTNVVSCLDEILMTWLGQKPAAVSASVGMVGLSEACVAQFAELKRIAEWKHGEICELNQVVESRSSQLSAVDVCLREKQKELEGLQSAVKMQRSALQQTEAELRQQRAREEKQITERKKDLDSLYANSRATEKRVEEIEKRAVTAKQAKMIAENELNESLAALSSARKDLEEASERKHAYTALEAEVVKLNCDCEQLRKWNAAVQNQLDETVRQKKNIQYRYRKLYCHAKSESQQLRSQLQESKLQIQELSLGQPLASNTLLDDQEAAIIASSPIEETRSHSCEGGVAVHGERQLGWRHHSYGKKSALSGTAKEVDTQSTTHCTAMKSWLYEQLSSYEERCKSRCLQSKEFVTTLRSRMHGFERSLSDTS